MSTTSTSKDNSQSKDPKVFISYSWTSDDHAEWVLNLANRLVSVSGVDVVIDRWNLQLGQDKYQFMESMVTDPTITHVLVICDRRYTEKANAREGGVGTESTIISKRVYDEAGQTKFIPIIAELDADKNPSVPVFIESRIYINLSDPRRFGEGYEELLRLLYGKPLHKKPERGRKPAFLDDAPTLSTTYKRQAFEEALMGNKSYAPGLAADYFEAVDSELQRLEVTRKRHDDPITEKVYEAVEQSIALRDDFIAFLLFMNQYGADARLWAELTNFYSKAVRFVNEERYSPTIDSHYHFILWEMFLYTVTLLMKSQRYDEANTLLSAPYSDFERADPAIRGIINGYGIFDRDMDELEGYYGAHLKVRYDQGRFAPYLLNTRSTHPKVKFVELRDVDCALMLRYWLDPMQDRRLSWRARTLIYAKDEFALPLFAQARSKAEFAKLKIILGVESKADLVSRINSGQRLPRFDFLWGNNRLEGLINLDHLDTL